MRSRPTVGLALGGGAIRGLAHVGVLQALEEAGIEIDYIAGTSIGAWVGAHYALYRDIRLLQAMTVGKRKEKLNALLDLNLKGGGVVRGEKLHSTLCTWLGEETQFEDLSIPVSICATNLRTGNEHVFTSGPLVPAIQASMSIPVLFKPFTYEGHEYIDGGLVNPLPITIVKEMGADIIIGVDLDPQHLFSEEATVQHNITDVAYRSLLILQHQLTDAQKSMDGIYIHPDVQANGFSGWRSYFTSDNNNELVKEGYVATQTAIRNIRKKIEEYA